MKNNLLTSMFVCLLAFSSLFSLAMIIMYNSSVHRVQAIQPKVMEANQVMGIMQALYKDCSDYNRTAKNPDMTRLLQGLTNAPVKPGVKPVGK